MRGGIQKNWIFWVLALIGTGVLHLFGNNAGTFAVFTVTAALPFLSGLTLLAVPKPSRLQCALLLPDFCAKDEELQGQLTVDCNGLLTFHGRCRLLIENLYSGEQTVTPLSFTAGKRHVTTARFTLQPQFSGELLIRSEAFALSDPLGFFQKRLPCTAEHIVSIMPDGTSTNTELEETPDSLADNDEYSMTRPGADSSEIYAIRPYAPGDPIRSIHWKLTEKLDKVMVREFGRPLSKQTAPETASAIDAQSSPAEGKCLCQPVPETGHSRLSPWLITAALLIVITGALLSMLEITAPQTTAAVPLRIQSITDGFMLLFNRLFTVSEQYQSYIYEKFTVTVPANSSDSYIFVALAIIALATVAYCGVMVKRKSTVMCLCAFVLFAGVQIYFGVFPAPAWTITLFAALFAAVMHSTIGGAKSLRSLAPFCSLAIILLVTAIITYPGTNPILSEWSEAMRDRFDEKIERPVTARMNPQELLTTEQLLELQRSAETVNRDENQPGGEEYNTENQQRFSGSQIGTAAAQRLWLLWLMLLLFAVGFAAWMLIRYRAYIKRQAEFDSSDCSAAINSMFLHLTRWLIEFGLKKQDNAYSSYSNPLETLMSIEYADEYLTAVALWQEAVYSAHELSPENRKQMRRFLDKTVGLIGSKANLLARARIRLRLMLSYGRAM